MITLRSLSIGDITSKPDTVIGLINFRTHFLESSARQSLLFTIHIENHMGPNIGLGTSIHHNTDVMPPAVT